MAFSNVQKSLFKDIVSYSSIDKKEFFRTDFGIEDFVNVYEGEVEGVAAMIKGVGQLSSILKITLEDGAVKNTLDRIVIRSKLALRYFNILDFGNIGDYDYFSEIAYRIFNDIKILDELYEVKNGSKTSQWQKEYLENIQDVA